MDLSNSVVLPREDFLELQSSAFGQTPTLGERTASSVQTLVVMAILTGAVAAGSWAWAWAMDWREQKSFDRKFPSPAATKTTDKK